MLTASCHPTCVQSQPPSERKAVQPLGQFVQPVQTTTCPGSAFAALVVSYLPCVRSPRSRLFLEPARHDNLAQRNFDTALPMPVLLRAGIRHSLGKRRQRAHRRRFARPPRFKNRAGLTIVGAASNLEIHDAWPLATHLIQHRSAQLLSARRTTVALYPRLESKFLNHRTKSRSQSGLSQIAQRCKKIFTNPSSRSLERDFSKRFIPLWG